MPAQRVQFINLPQYPSTSELEQKDGQQGQATPAEHLHEFFKNQTAALTYFLNQALQAINNGLLPIQVVTTLSCNASATAVVATFGTPVQTGLSYGTIIQPTWNTTWWVTPSNATSFTINFGTGPNVTSTFSIAVWLTALPA